MEVELYPNVNQGPMPHAGSAYLENIVTKLEDNRVFNTQMLQDKVHALRAVEVFVRVF